MKKRLLFPYLFCSLLTAISSCSEDEEPYPALITELADLYTDDQGTLEKIILDDDRMYRVENPPTGFRKNTAYRVLCDYQPSGQTAQLYRLEGAYILRDSSAVAYTHPTLVRSVWRTSRYINMHLAPKTQGGRQYWGFITDSITTSLTQEGDTLRHTFLTLHHNQASDPPSYTQEVYASLPLDSIQEGLTSSPVTLRIHTFEGVREFNL